MDLWMFDFLSLIFLPNYSIHPFWSGFKGQLWLSMQRLLHIPTIWILHNCIIVHSLPEMKCCFDNEELGRLAEWCRRRLEPCLSFVGMARYGVNTFFPFSVTYRTPTIGKIFLQTYFIAYWLSWSMVVHSYIMVPCHCHHLLIYMCACVVGQSGLSSDAF